jgi:glycosyltransferase involved in cell wall biosynthesis
MNKPVLVLQGPIATASGYGHHTRDLAKALRKMDKYDIKFVPMRWGATPQNQLDMNDDFGKWVVENVITTLPKKPDVFIQVSVANEFEPRGDYNIGITAGVESTLIPKDFIDGANKMDLIIVPSNFTKDVMKSIVYQEKRGETIVGEHRIVKPIEVLFEGINLDVFLNPPKIERDILEGVDSDWNFLIFGHWLSGELGQDRKDIGMSLKTIATTFKSLPEGKRPGIILKTSLAGFSVIEREQLRSKIQTVVGGDYPVYLLYGDLSNEEVSALYHHPKVKAMVSFTKGEGYGRPLAEFAATGKPVVVSNWSGHLDFLPQKNTVLLGGELTPIHPSASNKFLLKEAKWFTVNYSEAANKLYQLFTNYDKFATESAPLRDNIQKNFSLDKMRTEFERLLDTYVPKTPEIVPIKLPKLELPKLEKL